MTPEEAIIDLVEARGAEKSICPSEAARRLDADDWRNLMPTVRAAAARLADEGRVVVMQRGEAVDPRAAKGPIRIALRRRP
ncbi:MAG: DUF3253 domain-containing protein [Pseudomonadota bacterium]